MLIPQIIRLQAYDLDRIQQSEDQKTLHFEGDFRPEKPEPEFRKFRFRKTRGENELANFKNLFVNHQRMSRTCSQIRSEFQELVRKSAANFKMVVDISIYMYKYFNGFVGGPVIE